jgi:hypothetical protein
VAVIANPRSTSLDAPCRARRGLRRAADASPALALLALLLAGGCTKKIMGALIPDQPPIVRITDGPAVRDSLHPTTYHATVRWVGYDPDGRVDHYLYKVDPGSVDHVDSTWVSTRVAEASFTFEASTPVEPINPQIPIAASPHTLAVHAVDDQGERSIVAATRSFFAGTVAPFVRIVDPRATTAFTTLVPSTVRISWIGQDDDRLANRDRLERYVYRLFGEKNEDFPGIPDFLHWAQLHPDSLRRVYAPDFPGWTHVGGDTTSVQYRGLIFQTNYMFAVTGFDEAGAYDPIFTTARNLLKFEVTYATTAGPVITMFNQSFLYTYPDGGYRTGPSREFRLEVATDQRVTIHWFAIPNPNGGADMRQYRWVLDLVDLEDNTPRSDEDRDWVHWSTASLNIQSATFGPFVNDREEHLFYLEAEDNNRFRSLGIIRLRVVRPLFDKDLLLVNDTRLQPDFRTNLMLQDVDPPQGPWPTAAELDTFLYARGGFPWKSYPTGTLSAPGILNGYAFDTLSTRSILDGQVPLATLGRYRHVVWYVDDVGATYSTGPITASPITALRLASSPNRPANLSTYVTLGGRVWLAGGGAALATLIPWNRPGTTSFEYTDRDGELVPGRFMYDFAHWRSAIQMLPAIQAKKFGTTSFGVGSRPGRGWPGQPDYSALPATLQPKNPATDPVPPLRSADSYFYRSDYNAEHIRRANAIVEDDDPDSAVVHLVSTLDTLYLTSGGTALQNAAVMTYYHGSDCPPVVFSGFSFWYWRRPQCIALVDFVLRNVWGLPRDGAAPRGPTAEPVAVRRSAR